MLLFGRFQFVPGFWLGYLLIVGLHEMGHAFLARRMGLTAYSIDIHALGGQCRFGGASISPWQHAVVAWGGVIAQAILLAIALAISIVPLAGGPFLAQLLGALIGTNLTIMLLNLAPFPPLDGAQAWRILPLWRERRERRAAKRAQARLEVQPAPRDELELGPIDEAAVRETVKRALSEASRQARPGRRRDGLH